MLTHRLAIGAVLMLAATTGAHAQWRYCLTASDEKKEVYFSDHFPSNASLNALETSFGKMLQQSDIGHAQLQCPRAASEHEIVRARADAIKFNRDFFAREVIELHWTPNSSVEVNRGGAFK